MPNDTFDAGIEPGGLRDSNEIKVLLCYILKTVKKPLSFDSLNEILQGDGLVNYFEFAQSLHELLLSGHVDLIQDGGVDYYKVTRLGAGTAELFERRLPASIREKAVKAAVRLLARIRRESENRVEIGADPGGGYAVDCVVLDQGDDLMRVRLLVPDMRQAELVKRQFLQSPETVYKGVLALLTGDVQAVGELLAQQAKDQSDKPKK